MANYWSNNADLAEELRAYWGEPDDSPMDKVFPIRFYGDGADTIGLNAFELMTMIAVSPNHSSSLKTRIVFLEDVLLPKRFFPNNVCGKRICGVQKRGVVVFFSNQGCRSETLHILQTLIG